MNIMKKLILLLVLLAGSITVLGFNSTAQAALFDSAKGEACKGANLSSSDADCKSGAAATKLEGTIQFAVNLITVIVGIVAIILIIVNGLKFITSNGDSNAISSAKNGIIYAIVGLIVAAMAQIIVRFIISRI